MSALKRFNHNYHLIINKLPPLHSFERASDYFQEIQLYASINQILTARLSLIIIIKNLFI